MFESRTSKVTKLQNGVKFSLTLYFQILIKIYFVMSGCLRKKTVIISRLWGRRYTQSSLNEAVFYSQVMQTCCGWSKRSATYWMPSTTVKLTRWSLSARLSVCQAVRHLSISTDIQISKLPTSLKMLQQLIQLTSLETMSNTKTSHLLSNKHSMMRWFNRSFNNFANQHLKCNRWTKTLC